MPRRSGSSPSTTRSRCRSSKICICSIPSRPRCRAQAYDLVVNGEECGGGTIRCSRLRHPVQDLLPLLGLTRRGPGEVRVPAWGLAQRRPAARRDRAGVRPAGDALFGADQYPRLHRLPQDGQGDRPHDRERRGPSSPSSSRSCMFGRSDAEERGRTMPPNPAASTATGMPSIKNGS